MNDEPEEWRAVVGWECLYEVSSLGRVRSLDRTIACTSPRGAAHVRTYRGRILRQALDKGYPFIALHLAGSISKSAKVHQLVAYAFLGEPPEGHEVAHFDGDRGNPRLSNLSYKTRKGNHADRLRHGTHYQGEQNPAAVLTPAQVREIRGNRHISGVAMARKFGISTATVSVIRSRKKWRHLE